MHNELTQEDILMMRQELDHRRIEVRPALLEEVKVARAFGDLSENFEYKAAKQEKNKNEGRIRFLERMIQSAVIVPTHSAEGAVGLYDSVSVYLEDDQTVETYQIVTTMRQNVLRGLVSKESPIGRAMLGKKVGERFYIQVNERYGYYAEVRAIEKKTDDGSIPLNKY